MKVRALDAITEVPADTWNALIPPGSAPFIEHGHLLALEVSGLVRRAGMEPKHLTLWSGERLVAAAPAYLKHSVQFNQMMDWGHEIAKKHELPYGPTLVIAVPWGWEASSRFLIAPDIDRSDAIARLIGEARHVASIAEYPVVHVWSCAEDEAAQLARLGFGRQLDWQYAWSSDPYRSFDDYLARLNSKRRAATRLDRRRVSEAGVVIRTLRGDALTPDVMDLVWQCQVRTTEKYDGGDAGIFNREFFMALGSTFAHRLEVYVAELNGRPVATSLYAVSASELFSKGWGALEEVPHLHFELHWYHTFEEAIARRLRLVDAGGPGEHKLMRGFLPEASRHAATWIGDEDLLAGFSLLAAKERASMEAEIANARTRSPFRS